MINKIIKGGDAVKLVRYIKKDFLPTSFKYPLTQKNFGGFLSTSFKYPFNFNTITYHFPPTSFKYPLTLLIKSRILLYKDSAFLF